VNYRDHRTLPLALNAMGIAVVAYAFFSSGRGHGHPLLIIATVVALAAWGAMEVLQLRRREGEPDSPAVRRARRVVAAAGVAVASLTQVPSSGTHTAALAIILVLVLSDVEETIWFGAALSAVAFALTPVGIIIARADTPTALGYLAGNAVWVLIGISRRQAREATRRNRELLEQQQEAHVQETRAAALSARQAAARDIHDVLAHSLGGLVIQLDATEALLESGRTEDAAAKVAQARRLAADGLADARRAVAALRSPDETDASEHAPSDLTGAAERLLRAHRELGGEVESHLDLEQAPSPLPASVATAFERALQEALSNARRHAPGQPVAVELVASADRIDLTVANPVDPAGQGSDLGGGNGLTGMAERFAALAGGAATAGEHDGRFVVSATALVARG
jgi:signal transduction histidine kinase